MRKEKIPRSSGSPPRTEGRERQRREKAASTSSWTPTAGRRGPSHWAPRDEAVTSEAPSYQQCRVPVPTRREVSLREKNDRDRKQREGTNVITRHPRLFNSSSFSLKTRQAFRYHADNGHPIPNASSSETPGRGRRPGARLTASTMTE